jgi:hypothetical protein
MGACYYGCGQEAKYQFKNGKWCCNQNVHSCPEIKKKLCHRGTNNPMFGRTGNKHPMFGRVGELSPTFGKPGYWKGKKNPDNSIRMLGENNPMFGKISAMAGKKNLSVSKYMRSMTGDKNNNWNGGISFLPYSFEFNEELKNRIREKFSHTCVLCDNYAKIPHHIDYDKNNNEEENFVLLCNSCDPKVNYNRGFWETQFKILNEIFDPKFLGL